VLGEISAFGGINVEPSVRSCFKKAGDTGFIDVGFSAVGLICWRLRQGGERGVL
jgi:hypothetical protein